MNEKKQERRGLGRGLSALMADVAVAEPEPNTGAMSTKRPDQMLPIEKVVPNPDQPRRTFTQEALDELSASIKEKGIIQPLIVRRSPSQDGMYEIVAGERRWRAAQMAKLHEVPALIREFDDTEVLEIAIIENIQRADLNPVEEAGAYRQLMDRFGHTQEKLAEALGKSRSHIANLLRLLSLPPDVQEYLREGRLSAGHARALITTDDPSAIAREVVAKGLSVREAEKLAKGHGKTQRSRSQAPRAQAEKDADTRALELDLSAATGMGVSVDHDAGGESGSVTIRYKTLEQLDELCGLLSATQTA
ncbi:ParB/RepB/Spo0J family partition protein [Tranquillimonas alkanivorans]|uniref:Chromosome segregation DNA-binding protein n=1 Tax=Tranquillimonas alkanivorans TaxID=441119 RepID=A0A1I5LGQ8_9RHOB|nr:ParB/RepB/Spo0J family partition protein [Tranquillimonas alkanivorans]SFO96478.1 chromosome segregation DNA-binding protein [Tranquillimonas alkanivorans]